MSPLRVLVAGAGGGIGGATVTALREGAHQVWGVDRESVDITRPAGAEAAVAGAVIELGGLDGIVHAIGMSGRRLGDGPVTTCTDEAWAEILRVNLESAFRLVRAGLPVLAAEGGGSIVLVGSALAQTLDQDFLTVAYASAKAGLAALMRSAAFTGAPDGVRVNLVAPGLVDTPMAARALGDAAITGRLPQLQPLGGRAQSAEEVAEGIVFLLSDAARGLTGATLPLDRGWTLR